MSRFPGIPLIEPAPAYFLDSIYGEDNSPLRLVYFVNNTPTLLDKVSASSGGTLTADDDVVTMSRNSPPDYEKVLPSEAVWIADFDDIYDSDYINQFDIVVTVAGVAKVFSHFSKGCFGRVALKEINVATK